MKLLIHYGTENSFIKFGNKKITISNNIRSNNILNIIERELKKENNTIEAVKKIEVYPGPGSFTGVRVSVTIANVLSKILNVPIRYCGGEAVSQVIPEYGKSASISKRLSNN